MATRVSDLEQSIKQLILESRREIDPPADAERPLAARVNALWLEVSQLDGQPRLKKLMAKLMVLNTPAIRGSLGELPKGKMVTQFGLINQFSDRAGNGPNSSCTSCAQCFLARILPKGTIRSLHQEEIDTAVIDGWKNFDLLLQNKEMEAQKAGLSIFDTAMDCNECAMIYGLEIIRESEHVQPLRCLEKDAEGSTAPFFETLLKRLENQLGESVAIGGMIHAQGNTYSLALFQTESGVEYALFDSHGNATLNGGRDGAYVKYTDTRELMANFLSQLIPYKECHVVGLTEEQRKRIEADENAFILYALSYREHQLLGEISPWLRGIEPIVGDISPISSEVLGGHKDDEGNTTIDAQVACALIVGIIAVRFLYKAYLNQHIQRQVRSLSEPAVAH